MIKLNWFDNWRSLTVWQPKPECGPVEVAGFIMISIWILFQSGPKVAADKHLEKKSQNIKVHLIQDSFKINQLQMHILAKIQYI